MRQFYLIKNPEKPGVDQAAEDICRHIEERGGSCRIQEPGEKLYRGGQNHFQYTDACQVPDSTQCVITLGGDGTLIQAARDLAGRHIPMVGVNLGHVGYLTQIGKKENIEELLEALLTDQYQLEHRMMLKGSIHVNTALNISREHLAEMMIQGSSRGITSMWKAMKHNRLATNAAVELAQELVDFEQKNIERLKEYL